MARESQGLQIALIVFVMLTIILGVTTFLGYRSYDEASVKAAQSAKDAADAKRNESDKNEENRLLKTLIGVPVTEDIMQIDKEFKQEMTTYGGTYDAEVRYYRPMIKELAGTVKKKSGELTDALAQINKLQGDYKNREASQLPQIKNSQELADKSAKDRDDERAKFGKDREALKTAQDEVAAKLEEARKQSTEQMTKVAADVGAAEARLKKLTAENKAKTLKLVNLEKVTFELPCGEVRWVNQRNGTVWINLGQGDALSRLTTFSVYSSDAIDLSKAAKKASIEVSQILGEHSAEARVLEDKASDPIMPGDKIYSPIWAPGEKKHFALTGFLDIDGDNKSDLQVVKNLIAMNGGVVDCETDEKGERRGQMTANTRYLVLGEAPSIKGPPGVLAGYSRMLSDAERQGLEKVSLPELLQRMGWKNQTPVVHFGRGSSPSDMRAKPAEGGTRTSGGNVSEIFKPRTPPKSGAGGAY